MLTATRLAVNGRRYQFLSNLLNIIDIISILPFYASVIAASSDSDFDPTGLVGLRVLRFIRILRIFKLGRYNSGLRLLLATLHDSKAELAVLLIFLSIAVTLFGSLMFIIENAACDDYDQTTPTNADDCQEGFGSIPRSMWWAVRWHHVHNSGLRRRVSTYVSRQDYWCMHSNRIDHHAGGAHFSDVLHLWGQVSRAFKQAGSNG